MKKRVISYYLYVYVYDIFFFYYKYHCLFLTSKMIEKINTNDVNIFAVYSYSHEHRNNELCLHNNQQNITPRTNTLILLKIR